MLKAISLAALSFESGKAQIGSDESTITKLGAHSEHTRTESGEFKHPFLTESKEVTTIHYPDSKTYSLRLNKMASKSRHHSGKEQEILRGF